MANSWNADILNLLEKVRKNSIVLSEYHRKRFYHFKSFTKYFDLPILVFSSFGASFAVGSQGYLKQADISLTSCIIGLFISIITSIKLYLNIEDSMMNELKMSKDFYTLSIDIYKVLHLTPEDRGEDGLNYLNKKYASYTKLVENSNLLKRRFKTDNLANIDKKYMIEGSDEGSNHSEEDLVYDIERPETPKLNSVKKMPLKQIIEVETETSDV